MKHLMIVVVMVLCVFFCRPALLRHADVGSAGRRGGQAIHDGGAADAVDARGLMAKEAL